LANWQEGEITEARPLSAVQRARRWARRAPLISALTLAVALLLVLATGGSVASVTLLYLSIRERSVAVEKARQGTEKGGKEAQKADEARRLAEAGTRELEAETRHALAVQENYKAVVEKCNETKEKREQEELKLKEASDARNKAQSRLAETNARIGVLEKVADS